MNIERLMEKEKMTPKELKRYLEISFQVAMGFRTIPTHKDYVSHLNHLIQTDDLIAGYVISLSMLN